MKDLRYIKIPAIAHIILENGYNHYIVVKKIDNKYIHVFDPAIGTKKYEINYFNKIWDNVIIELIPNRKLDVINNKNFNLFIDIVNRNKVFYILVIFISFISIILTLYSNYYFKNLIEKKDILMVLLIFSFIIVLKEFVDYIKNLIIIKLGNNIDKDITINTHNKLLLLPYYYFNTRSTGDIISKVHDLDYVKELFIKIPIFLFVDLILLIFLTIILINVNKILFILFIIVCVLYFLVLILFDKKTKNMIRTNQEDNALNNEILIENISSINTIKNLNIVDHRCNIFNMIYNKYLNNKMKYEKFYSIENLIKNLILFIGVNIILYVGIIYTNKNILNLSDLILFNSLILYYIDSLNSIFELNPLLKNSINALRRITEIYLINHSDNDTKPNNYNIKINNLCFSYDGYNNILKNVNFNIDYKDKVVVIGSSGSGKSTLFKLINKTYEVDDKCITIGNIDINGIDTKSFITYVSQEETLFKDTLYNNLVLDNNIELSYLNSVINITGLNVVMKNKRIGLNSIILENGINFSKGEKQKIILSRVLLKNNKILILDEALNGVEEDEECGILSKILEKYNDKTIIYITHRKKCISLFDKILDFEEVK